MIVRLTPIELLLVVTPHSLLLDLAGPAEAFRLADLHRAARGLPPRFRLRFVGPAPTAVTSVGLDVTGLAPLPRVLKTPTWVILAGQPAAKLRPEHPAILTIARWLRALFEDRLGDRGSVHRVVGICSGALLAARAGLCAGRQCTTHHELIPTLRRMAPEAQVVENRVFVVDGALATSAGITAGIDLALHLIAEECGESLAAEVAEDMVVYLRRSPRDPELSPFLAYRRHLHPAVHRVQDAIVAAPERDWDMPALALVAHTTERHLLRLFTGQVGVSPLEYLRSIRLERARQLLEGGATVTRAAEVAGFRSALQLRRAWGRTWGGTPRRAIRLA